jgi:uncharacterized repeat protein (TIGR02543 family)
MAGSYVSAALSGNGELYTWGAHHGGMLGVLGAGTNAATPQRVGTDADWGVPLPKYQVQFDAQGGSEAEPRRVLKGYPVGTLPTPARADYLFKGWFHAPVGQGGQVFENMPVTADTTLYASWHHRVALLNGVKLSKGTRLDKKFSSSRSSYRIRLKAKQKSVNLTLRKASPASSLAYKLGTSKWKEKALTSLKVSIKQGKKQTLLVRVTAEDGLTLRTYKFIISRAKPKPKKPKKQVKKKKATKKPETRRGSTSTPAKKKQLPPNLNT